MTRRCCRFILLLGLLATFWLSPVALAGNYETGVAAYKQKNYTNALKYFTAAAKENPGNADAIFYLGLTQVKMNKLQDARQSFEMVTRMLPASDERAAKARNNISFITQNQIANVSTSAKAQTIVQKAHSRSSKPNYLTHVLPGGAVIHFDVARMPLKVYIAPGKGVPGWDASYNSAVSTAMQTWQSASKGRIRFMQTNTPNNADIVVRWQKNFSHGIIGLSPINVKGTTITQSDVTLALYYPNSDTLMDMNTIRSTAVHEFGHALGIRGHSPYPEDVMYFSDNDKNSATLSTRDRNTIDMLYSIEADVKSSSTMSTAESKKYFDFLEQGYKAEKAGQIAQAMQLYRSAMTVNAQQYEAKYALAILLTNQGVEYINNKNAAQAKRNFQDSVNLFKQVVATPGAPAEAKQGLQIAEKNLALASGAP